MDRPYIDTVRLLLTVAPVIFESPRFALKGGTALNLFVQDMPRLSVDIDVVFTDHVMEREAALIAIGDEPDWTLMPFDHLKDLPAIRWKLLNLEKLRTTNKPRFELQATELMDRFGRLPR